MNCVYLQSVGVVAPGLSDWNACRDVLCGRGEYTPAPIARFSPATLPANERRRLTPTIRLALRAASEAMQSGTSDPSTVATVFATCSGDLDISDRICSALNLRERPVSPTDFHNSVHNAPAGYWSIGSHSHRPSTSLSAGAATVAAGLLEAVTQTLCDNHPVMLVVNDRPPPAILASDMITIPFSAALLIDRQHTADSVAELRVTPVRRTQFHGLRNAALDTIRPGAPAAQILLLLELLAMGTEAECVLPCPGNGGLLIEYSPCS